MSQGGAPVQYGQFDEIFVVAGDGPEDTQVFTGISNNVLEIRYVDSRGYFAGTFIGNWSAEPPRGRL